MDNAVGVPLCCRLTDGEWCVPLCIRRDPLDSEQPIEYLQTNGWQKLWGPDGNPGSWFNMKVFWVARDRIFPSEWLSLPRFSRAHAFSLRLPCNDQHSTDALAILPCDSQNAWCVDQCCVSARVLNECIHVLPLLSHTLSFSRALSLALSLSRSSSLPLSLPLPACACVCACECRAVQALFNLQWNGKKVCFVLCGSAECMYVFVE
jgi:hypothetical protein